jgi:hypothetical protein
LFAALLAAFQFSGASRGQAPSAAASPASSAAQTSDPTAEVGGPPGPTPPPLPEGAIRLVPSEAVWIDRERTRVILGGRICLRQGPLEMFACPAGTKEHESIVAFDGTAQTAHAALLVVGAQVGTPVRFSPQYSPATGTEIDVQVAWLDTTGRWRQSSAQEWIRGTRTKAAMTHRWVFAGSGFWTDESNGQRVYLGDSGDFICVSNFPSATLDLPIQSSAENAALLFEAFTENIPPTDTQVQITLTPRISR